jgi:B3 DNA binding domain
VQRIPKKFAETIKGSVGENIELESPRGTAWHVKMIRSNETLVLQSGWKQFVAANNIVKNDSLVFIYDGNSSFKVLIFDPCGCEKAASYFATKMEMFSEESDDSSIRVGAVPHHEAKKEIICLSSGSDTEFSSEIPSRSARVGMNMTGGSLSCKRKQRGTYIVFICCLSSLILFMQQHRFLCMNRTSSILYATKEILILAKMDLHNGIGFQLVLLTWEGSILLVLNTIKPDRSIFFLET